MDFKAKLQTAIFSVIITLLYASFSVAGSSSTVSVQTTACSVHNLSCSKDISNIVYRADGVDTKIEPLSGHDFTLTKSNVSDIWIKCGRNFSGDGPGYGQRVAVDDTELCNPPPEFCEIDAECSVTGRCGEGGKCVMTMTGRVFYDDDRNGVYTVGEVGVIALVRIQVNAPIGWIDLTLDVTDEEGVYNAFFLNSDFEYRIGSVEAPPGEPPFVYTSQNIGTDDSIDSDVNEFGISDAIMGVPDFIDANTWVGVLRNLP